MSACNAVPMRPDAVAHANDAVNVAEIAVCFINNRIHPMISAIVALADFNAGDGEAAQTRLSLILDVAKLGRYLVEDVGGCLESEQSNALSKLIALKGTRP